MSSSNYEPTNEDVFSAHILIVEDSKLVINQVTSALAFYDQKTTVATNGDKALRILNSKPAGEFDLVMMDIEMETMDGLRCIRYIREGRLKDPKKTKIPTVAVTGNAKELSLMDFMKLGFNDVIVKPLDVKKIFSMLNKFLSRPS